MVAEKICFYDLVGINEEGNVNNRILFTIPEFQRGYSWETEQLYEFLEDLKKGFTLRNEPGFSSLGVFYLYTKDQTNFEIIDGQQRFTTTLIVLEAAKSTLSVKNFKHSIYNEDRKRILSGYSKDSQLEKIYKEFFDFFISNKGKSDENLVDDTTVKNMINTYQDVKEYISEEFPTDDAKNEFYNYLLHEVHFWPYIERNDDVKIDLFMKLNSRGRQLSFSTLLKSYLYSIDDIELVNQGMQISKQSVFAKFYEESIEEPLMSNYLKAKKLDAKERFIQASAANFLHLNSWKYIDEFKNEDEPFSQAKAVFIGYTWLLKDLFKRLKAFNDGDKAVAYGQEFMNDLKVYMIKYVKYCVNYEHDICKKLADISIVKYNPLIVWLDIYAEANKLDKKVLNEIFELIFVYLYSRRLRWFVENKSQLEFDHKTDQLNPRNLSYAEIARKVTRETLKFEDIAQELKSLLNEELLEKVKAFFDGDFEIWKKSNMFEKTIQYKDYYLELLDKYNIKI
ncbi:hypothetical protein SHELI_v1c04420 [Spiroplasma helicoides]|uniref:GmrSD restriction endonucleases N-terminal domain-containing protein n=1 Tax=Spiroplasma helicoides TaxID=216938 RepID=A0A1B3SKC9_9MOLU|nr:DUF262 domain-containing protein [Spiroplasma helicoides]AOG60393.1 hypothetical protein SHELI_v1c04420 [Spiroplasma helicoides]